jgi:hypothetical protein
MNYGEEAQKQQKEGEKKDEWPHGPLMLSSNF